MGALTRGWTGADVKRVAELESSAAGTREVDDEAGQASEMEEYPRIRTHNRCNVLLRAQDGLEYSPTEKSAPVTF